MADIKQPLLPDQDTPSLQEEADGRGGGGGGGHLKIASPELKNTQKMDTTSTENERIGFWHMTILLVWKNYMMQCRRRPKAWLCKILFPAVFFIILGLIRLTAQITNKEADYDSYDNPSFTSSEVHTYNFTSNLLCNDDHLNWPPGLIGIVNPNNNKDVEAVLAIMQSHWETSCNLDPALNCSEQAPCIPWGDQENPNGILLKYFATNDDLNDYCTGDDYGKSWDVFSTDDERPISIAIVFDEPSNYYTWSYEIRANSSRVPVTLSEDTVDQFEHDPSTLWKNYGKQYKDSGFVYLQVFIDNAITEYIASMEGNQSVSKYTYDLNRGYQAFPTAAFESDNYWDNIAFAFTWFIIFGFVYPFNQVASQLVDEKSYKTKEGMKMMGATITTYWTAWYIWLWFEFTLIITLCWAAGTVGQVFKYSDPGVIFVWLYMFGLSVMTFGTMVSTIFDSPRTAATLCNVLLIFGVSGGLAGTAMTSEAQKNALCLLAPACLTVSVTSVIQYETGLIGLQWNNINEQYQYFRFSNSILIMAVDIIIYFLLTLYLDRVWPSRYGQREPWYFLFSPTFWCPSKNKKPAAEDLEDGSSLHLRRRMSSLMTSDVYEPVGDDYINKGPAISMRDLKKTFGDAFGQNEVKAVNGVSLDIYQGEVFCLLGHNGAGKTTTIGMLTGLLEISGGYAYIGGNNVKTQMGEIRRSMGVCPQHDVLWPRLTCQEHLELFARLKGVPKDRVKEEAEKTLESVGLGEKKNEFPPNMSGGQKRKLSLGIALIGGSKIVFLDEPTSGMDPQSRRVTWNLIAKEKRNRAIVLTTHFMDEADILGDRIAIMSSGEVRCCGSPLFLKQKFGVGYTFVVSLEVGVKPAVARNAIDSIVTESIEGANVMSIAGGEIAYRLPFSETKAFPDLFEAIDAKKKELKISSYGVSVTTLEEVFMKILEDYDDIDQETGTFVSHRTKSLKEGEPKETSESHNYESSEQKYEGGITNSNKKKKKEKKDADASLAQMFAQPTFRLQHEREWDVLANHCWAIMYKRFWWAIRDGRAMFFIIFLPCLITALNFGVQNLQLGIDYPNLVLDVNQWYSPDDYTMPTVNFTNPSLSENELYNSNWIGTTYVHNMTDQWGSVKYYDVNISYSNDTYSNQTWWDWKEELLNHRGDSSKYMHYTSIYFEPLETRDATPGFNLSAAHGFPTSFNMLGNLILKHLFPSLGPSITLSSHPLPATSTEKVFANSIIGLTASITLTIAFVFIPVGIVFPVVQERKQQMKHQQMVSGVSFASYWCGQFAADFIVALPTCALVVAMVHIFDISAFMNGAEAPFIVAILLFLMSALPLTYLLSLLFDSPDKAQASMAALYTLLGLVLSIVTFVLMNISDTTKEVNDVLKYFFQASPMYCLAYSLIWISFKPFARQSDSYWAYDLTGECFVAMAVEAVLYFSLLLAIEYVSGFPSLMTQMGFNIDVPKTEAEQLDEDVAEEQKRVRNDLANGISLQAGTAEKDTVQICGLRKVYKLSDSETTHKVAVKDLWFGIPQGQVFGFLGVNGAGKTTTLKMMTGDTHPSDGEAFIHGISIKNQILARRMIGYCPQFDAIFDLLTAYEHLKFYGTVKGLKGEELEEQIRVLLNALSLNKYQNRKAGTYSGGNKRKLSAAIAMIGNPPVVFLDEPSTGMDPVSRRHMWSFINTTMEGRCVILTTHSMEECEALCHRLGIMVNGQLRCLGTPQHLKSRFGKGYQLDITFETREAPEERKKLQETAEGELNKHFKVTLLEATQNKATFQLEFDNEKEGEMTLAQMFRTLEDIKEQLSIVSYALNQTTLEQIFVRMAQQYGAVSEF